MKKLIIPTTIIIFLAILGVFVLGILRPELVSPVWGTNEVANNIKNKLTGETTKEVILPAKTIWDLFNLLLVPIVIAVGGYLFNHAQQDQNQKIALDRDQEQGLQNYLDKMGELLLENKLRTTKDKVILNLARSRTLTILRSLNNSYLDVKGRGRNRRKGSLARFLYEMNLISGKKPVVSLREANLSYAYMHSLGFSKANFEGAFLGEADLRNADLQDAFLSGVYLTGARLNGAHLERANLTKADLKKAILKGAYLDGAILDDAELQGATMPDGSIHE